MTTTHINRLRCSISNTPGTSGNVVVGAATSAARRTFTAAEDGKSFEPTFEDGTAWETRTGCVYTHATSTLTRGTLVDSSTGSAIALTSAATVGLHGTAKAMQDLEPARNTFHFSKYGPDLTGATDCTALLNTALADLYAAGGGTLIFPTGKILIAGQIILPNDNGAGAFPTGALLQPSMRWMGQGAYGTGQTQSNVEDGSRNPGGTVLLCTYTNATYNNAKFVTRGLGLWECSGITFQDTTITTTTPFLFTTATTLHIHDCAFVGRTGGTSCTQDAIVLGGKQKLLSSGYGDPDASFQGYGTVIASNYFQKVRRAIYGRSYCNQVQIYSNFMDKGCGTNTAAAGCIEFDGTLDTLGNINGGEGDTCTNNAIYGNYLEWVGGYTYLIILRKCSRTYVGFNGFIDSGPNMTAGVRMEGQAIGPGYPSTDNMIIGNSNAIDVHISEDTLSLGRNWVIGGGASEGFTVPFSKTLKFSTGSNIAVNAPTNTASWKIWDQTTDWLKLSATTGIWDSAGSLRINGNTNSGSAAGTTTLTIGNNSSAADAILNFNAPSGQNNQIQFKRAGVNSWLFYDANSSLYFFRDSVNGVMAMTLNPGSGTTGRVDFGGTVRIAGAKIEMASGGPTWTTGTGSPEGVVTAPIGSLYSNLSGGASTTLYVKTSGAGNTGWTAK